jgi:hypothetical protein
MDDLPPAKSGGSGRKQESCKQRISCARLTSSRRSQGNFMEHVDDSKYNQAPACQFVYLHSSFSFWSGLKTIATP